MKFILTLLCMIALSAGLMSCSSTEIKETLSEKVSHTASKVIIAELQCLNGDVVTKDMKLMTDKLFKVEEVNKMQASAEPTVMGLVSTKSVEGSSLSLDSKVLICRSVTGALLPVVIDLAKAGKLTEWGCSVEKGEGVLMDLVYKGCDKLAKIE